MRVKTIFWAIWALIGLLVEGIALVNGVPNDTLTGAIVTHLPGWLVFCGVGWLGWHFTNSYLNNRDER